MACSKDIARVQGVVDNPTLAGVRELRRLLASTDERVTLAAAKAVLELGFGPVGEADELL